MKQVEITLKSFASIPKVFLYIKNVVQIYFLTFFWCLKKYFEGLLHTFVTFLCQLIQSGEHYFDAAFLSVEMHSEGLGENGLNLLIQNEYFLKNKALYV